MSIAHRSIDHRMRSGLAGELAGIDPAVAAMLVNVESGARRQRTRRNVVLAAVAAVVAIAGVVWAAGSFGSLTGQDEFQPIQQPSEPDGGRGDPGAAGPAQVLAEYQQARDVDLVSEGSVDPQQWLDSLMSLYAQDAVVTGHPLDTCDPPIATGRDAIAGLEASCASPGTLCARRVTAGA